MDKDLNHINSDVPFIGMDGKPYYSIEELNRANMMYKNRKYAQRNLNDKSSVYINPMDVVDRVISDMDVEAAMIGKFDGVDISGIKFKSSDEMADSQDNLKDNQSIYINPMDVVDRHISDMDAETHRRSR